MRVNACRDVRVCVCVSHVCVYVCASVCVRVSTCVRVSVFTCVCPRCVVVVVGGVVFVVVGGCGGGRVVVVVGGGGRPAAPMRCFSGFACCPGHAPKARHVVGVRGLHTVRC